SGSAELETPSPHQRLNEKHGPERDPEKQEAVRGCDARDRKRRELVKGRAPIMLLGASALAFGGPRHEGNWRVRQDVSRAADAGGQGPQFRDDGLRSRAGRCYGDVLAFSSSTELRRPGVASTGPWRV